MSRVRKKTAYKKLYILISVFILIFVLLFATAQGKYKLQFSERMVATMLSPFQGVFMNASNFISRYTANTWELITVYQQNKMLMSEVEQLRAIQVSSTEIKAENERLRSLLNYKQGATQFDLVAAQVIARDPGNWTNSIIVNRGSNDGIRKDLAVITPQGLVGSVVAVFDNYSRVQLILDPRSSVGGLVQRPESRVAGIIEGNPKDKTSVSMLNVPRDADIVEGDNIVTSGFGGIYPKGILVGKVSNIANDEGGLLKVAVLEPAVNFQKLEEVAIIVQSREAMPEPLNAPKQAAAVGNGKNVPKVGDTK